MDEISHSEDKNLLVENLVAITAGKAAADSRVVAKAFGKEHKNVLQAIDNLLARLSRLAKATA